MTPDQFEHALSLTRCRGRAAEAARLHFVDGLSLTDAAKQLGITVQTVNRSVDSIKKQLEDVKMSARKLGIYLADDSLSFLEIIQSRHGEDDLNLSSAVNLCIQLGKLVLDEKLRMSVGELLLCCDVLNGGASLVEFDTPNSASIARSLESMKWSLLDAHHYESMIFEKWDVERKEFYEKIDLMSVSELFTLAIATRSFWSDIDVSGRQPQSKFQTYEEWAAQWID